jgi:hypothetical protein
LRAAQTRSDEIAKDMEEDSKTITDLMVKMTTLNYEKLELNASIALMKEGIEHLSKIKGSWSNLTVFFTDVAVHTEILINTTTNGFVKYVESEVESSDTPGDDGSSRSWITNLLAGETPDILKGAHFIYTLSSAYMDLSQRLHGSFPTVHLGPIGRTRWIVGTGTKSTKSSSDGALGKQQRSR